MYSELLKASASVKMTMGDAVTPSGKRPRLNGFHNNGFDDGDKGSPSKKKQKKAAAPKTTKKARGKQSLLVGDDGGAVEEGDDESFGEGDQDVSCCPFSFQIS